MILRGKKTIYHYRQAGFSDQEIIDRFKDEELTSKLISSAVEKYTKHKDNSEGVVWGSKTTPYYPTESEQQGTPIYWWEDLTENEIEFYYENLIHYHQKTIKDL